MSKEWSNRIVGYSQVPASDLLANPQNARRHPAKQREALRGSLDTLGWVAPVLLNKRTGFLIDGHARVEEALSKDENMLLPVLEVDLSEEEEKLFLASFDYITLLAQYDRDSLDSLLQDINTDNEQLQAMLSEMAEEHDLYFEHKSLEENYLDISSYDIPDALFPSDNEFGIPCLDITMQADALDMPFELWGYVARSHKMNGTYGFYTDDFKFNALWTDPSPVVNSKCVNVIEPNFSTNLNMPRAVALWGIYRKRWLARYWQSQGIKVFVDMNVEPIFAQDNLFGVPYGWKAYCTRGYEDYLDDLKEQHQKALDHSQGNPLFVVYGGGHLVQEYCKKNAIIWLNEVMSRKRE